jgi:hypothetical protein
MGHQVSERRDHRQKFHPHARQGSKTSLEAAMRERIVNARAFTI